jgi:hypothetical protein
MGAGSPRPLYSTGSSTKESSEKLLSVLPFPHGTAYILVKNERNVDELHITEFTHSNDFEFEETLPSFSS